MLKLTRDTEDTGIQFFIDDWERDEANGGKGVPLSSLTTGGTSCTISALACRADYSYQSKTGQC